MALDIKAAIKAHNLTSKEVAERMGITTVGLSAMLNRFRFVFVCRRHRNMICFYDVVNNNFWEQYLAIPTLKVRYGV